MPFTKYAFPNGIGAGDRFINLINIYSNWEYKNYVSILLLNGLLIKEKNKKCFLENEQYKKLEQKINEVKNKWGQVWEYKSPGAKEADLTIEELEIFRNEKYCKLIEMSRYPSVIYQMRNHMIHNLRFVNPLAPFDISNIKEPFYYRECCFDRATIKHKKKLLPSDGSYELYISNEIVPMLVEECSKNLKVKVMQEINKYDPNKVFKIKPDWFHKLPRPKKCY